MRQRNGSFHLWQKKGVSSNAHQGTKANNEALKQEIASLQKDITNSWSRPQLLNLLSGRKKSTALLQHKEMTYGKDRTGNLSCILEGFYLWLQMLTCYFVYITFILHLSIPSCWKQSPDETGYLMRPADKDPCTKVTSQGCGWISPLTMSSSDHTNLYHRCNLSPSTT